MIVWGQNFNEKLNLLVFEGRKLKKVWLELKNKNSGKRITHRLLARGLTKAPPAVSRPGWSVARPLSWGWWCERGEKSKVVYILTPSSSRLSGHFGRIFKRTRVKCVQSLQNKIEVRFFMHFSAIKEIRSTRSFHEMKTHVHCAYNIFQKTLQRS